MRSRVPNRTRDRGGKPIQLAAVVMGMAPGLAPDRGLSLQKIAFVGVMKISPLNGAGMRPCFATRYAGVVVLIIACSLALVARVLIWSRYVTSSRS
jgi:hypothetical protein